MPSCFVTTRAITVECMGRAPDDAGNLPSDPTPGRHWVKGSIVELEQSDYLYFKRQANQDPTLKGCVELVAARAAAEAAEKEAEGEPAPAPKAARGQSPKAQP